MQVNSRSTGVRVGLISTEPIRVAGLGSAFDHHSFIQVVPGNLDALLGDSALRLLILDLSFEPNWFDILEMVRNVRPDIRQVIIGPPGEDEQILRSIRAGARAYLVPSAGPLALRQAVEAVIQGTIWAPRRLLSVMIDRLMIDQHMIDRRTTRPAAIPAAAPSFSPRERQVLDLIMNACSNREIAEELGIEERTVKAYVTSLMRKTGVDNRVSLSVRATRNANRDQRAFPSRA